MIFFLDMDGVLVDTMSVYLSDHNVDPKNWPPGEWDVEKAFGIPSKNWLRKSSDWWAKLPPTSLLPKLQAFLAGKRTYICTTLTAEESYCGKVAWLEKHWPEMVRRVIPTDDKWLLAQFDRVLVDDKDSNVNEWTEYGGRGILVPRIWNSLHALTSKSDDTVLYSLNRSH